MRLHKYLVLLLFVSIPATSLAQNTATNETISAPVASTNESESTAAVSEPASTTDSSTGDQSQNEVSAPENKSYSFEDEVEQDYSDEALSADLDALLQDEEEDLISFGLKGYYRVRGIILDEPDLLKAEKVKNLAFVQHRLWLTPEIRLNKTPSVKLTGDIIVGEGTSVCKSPSLMGIHTHSCTGMWGANGENVLSTNTADQFANITFLRVWGEARTPVGVVRAGRQASHWGLGLFSNDGQHDQLFGDNHAADTYDRLAFATKPLGEDSDLIVALVGDKIVEGSPTLSATGLGNNDDAFEAIGLVLYSTDPLKAGYYQVFRKQSSTRSKIFISDMYAYLDIGLIYGGFEMLWLYGDSQGVPHTKVGNQLEISYPNTKINVWAWAAEIGLRGTAYDGIVRFGNVTGDQNELSDGTISSFSLNPNYRAGLIMWDYANANRAERVLEAKFDQLEFLKDEGKATQAQIDELKELADLNRTRGAINNAFFINPVIQYHPTTSIEAKFGFLWAQANDEILLLAGNANSPRGRTYGYEFDIGLMYTINKVFELGFEAAYLLPGDAFDRVPTSIDPKSGTEVAIAGSTIKPDHGRMAMFKATWNIDY